MNKNEALRRAAEELFAMAKDLGQFAGEIIFTPYGKLRINRIPRSSYIFQLKKFEKAGLIKKDRKKYGANYVLTDEAKRLRARPLQKARRSDELSSIIIFDIPEEKHKARDNFRRYLIKNGYTQLQKSVFISPFEIFDELKEFIDELGIKEHITFLSGRVNYRD
ncbi:MAG: CRISPR-associated endonuclease Cas2 [Candidatus Doudnabacteria bacterium]